MAEETDINSGAVTATGPAQFTYEDKEILRSIWSRMPVLDSLVVKIDSALSRLEKVEKRVEVMETTFTDLENAASFLEVTVEEVKEELTDAKETFATTEQVRKLQSEIVDLSNRSRRNNIVLHNVPEEAEGKGTIDCTNFVNQFLKEKVNMSRNIEIERAHRSPVAPKPPAGATPRPIHVKFLRHKDRQEILHSVSKALRKDNDKIHISDDVHEETRKQHKLLLPKMYELRRKGNFAFIPWSVPRVIKYSDEPREAGKNRRLKTIRAEDLTN